MRNDLARKRYVIDDGHPPIVGRSDYKARIWDVLSAHYIIKTTLIN
jgi:hypothetical protein